MPSKRAPRLHRGLLWAFVAFYAAACWMASGSATEARVDWNSRFNVIPDLQYLGNASCAGSECHSADRASKQSGQMIGDEANIWAEYDPHALAYESLSNAESKKISGALSIADATTSDRCLSCHAINAPAEQQGEKFALINAVGCESCHGPAQKWLEPHKSAGWTMEQRNTKGHQGLLKEYGLVDTSNLAVRADICVACHLQIDKDMVDAGHPPLEFEMYAYNYYVSKDPSKEYAMHWGDGLQIPTYWDARLWAAGQIAANKAAGKQVSDWNAKGWDTTDAKALAAIYSGGLAIVKKHFGTDDAGKIADAALTPGKVAAAAAELATLAPKAQNQIHRRILTYGVSALATSALTESGKNIPDALWDDYYAALEAGDAPAFGEALTKLAAHASGL